MRRLCKQYVSDELYQEIEMRSARQYSMGLHQLSIGPHNPYQEYFHSGLMMYYIR